MSLNEPVRRIEQLVQLALMLMLVVGCWLVLQPFFTAILFSIVIAISSWPFYRWLRQKLHGRILASLISCLAVILLLVGPAALLSVSLADGLAWLIESGRSWIAAGPPPAPAWLLRVPMIGAQLVEYWDRLAANTGEAQALLLRFAEPARNLAFSTGRVLGGGLVQVAFAIFLLFFMYRDGDRLSAWLLAGTRRIVGPATPELMETAQHTVVGVMLGVVGTALAQAMVALLGFMIAGVPAPFLLGALTFVVSMIPVGPPLIWGGAAIWLFQQGEPGWGLFMLAYGMFGISMIDNVIKPFLISRSSHLPFALTLMGVIGGVLAFGFMGVFIGPTLLALAISLGGRWLSRPEVPDEESPSPPAAPGAVGPPA